MLKRKSLLGVFYISHLLNIFRFEYQNGVPIYEWISAKTLKHSGIVLFGSDHSQRFLVILVISHDVLILRSE